MGENTIREAPLDPEAMKQAYRVALEQIDALVGEVAAKDDPEIQGAVEMARHWMRHPERITEAGFPQVSRELYTISRALVRVAGVVPAQPAERSIMPDDVTDEEAEAFLDALEEVPAQPAEDWDDWRIEKQGTTGFKWRRRSGASSGGETPR